MPAGSLVLRADASVSMGTGHVMRCLALAQAWQDEGGKCVLAMAESTEALERRLAAEGMEVVRLGARAGSSQDADELSQLALIRGASWVVADGYHFRAEYQRGLKDAGLKVLLVDDSGRVGAYNADLVLDQGACVKEDLYRSSEPCSRLLLGPRYALLRREFHARPPGQRLVSSSDSKILVTMGGSDPHNVTLQAIQALARVRAQNIRATIVAGGSNPHREDLEKQLRISGANGRLLRDPANMATLMAEADMAVSAAGVTCWEMCFLGLPAILVDVAENQRPMARALDRLGIGVHLGSGEDATPEAIAEKLEWLLASPEVRAQMSERGRNLVDGRGAMRVVRAMQVASLQLRLATEADCEVLWEWVNEPETRANSFFSGPVSREEHWAWFHRKVADPRALLFLGVDPIYGAVGLVRYDLEEARAVLSISVAAKFRRRGYGDALLHLAVPELFRRCRADAIDAYVKAENEASLRMFSSAGFRRLGEEQVRGVPAIHFSLPRSQVS